MGKKIRRKLGLSSNDIDKLILYLNLLRKNLHQSFKKSYFQPSAVMEINWKTRIRNKTI